MLIYVDKNMEKFVKYVFLIQQKDIPMDKLSENLLCTENSKDIITVLKKSLFSS